MNSRTFQTIIVILAAIATVSATDIFLPSLPSMATYFGAKEDMTQLAIPIYLLGSLLAAPVLGFLSDHFGRRPVMLAGLSLFLLGTVTCIYSPSLIFFLGGRFIQGFGGTVSPVVGWAIIQDLYNTDESAKIMSWMGSVVSIAPLVAPGLGGYIHITFGWQGNFLFVFLLCAITMILMFFSKPPIKAQSRKEKLSSLKAFKNYTAILKDKPFLFYISFFALLNCGTWCYLTIIPFYFENVLGLSPDIFGLYLSASASFYILGTLLTPIILKRLKVNKTLAFGIILALVGSISLFFVSILVPTIPYLIVISVALYLFGAAIIWGPSTSRALQRFEDIRGAASGVRSLILTASFALGGFVGSIFNDTSLVSLALFLFAMAMVCWVFFKKLVQQDTKIESKGVYNFS